jgi:hypothetical protein
MKSLENLLDEFAGKTNIQIEEHLKTVIGSEVEVLGELGNVSANLVILTNAVPDRLNASVTILYDGEQLRQELLAYSRLDTVRLTMQLTRVVFAAPNRYTFNLTSICKLRTDEQRRR